MAPASACTKHAGIWNAWNVSSTKKSMNFYALSNLFLDFSILNLCIFLRWLLFSISFPFKFYQLIDIICLIFFFWFSRICSYIIGTSPWKFKACRSMLTISIDSHHVFDELFINYIILSTRLANHLNLWFTFYEIDFANFWKFWGY